MFVTPAVAGGVAYVGSCSGVYYAFDVVSGAIRWQYDFKSDIGQATFHGDPLITDRLVITPTESLRPTHARALQRQTGRTVWQQTGDWAFTRSDVIGVGQLVVGKNDDGELIALAAETGAPVWRVPHGGRRFRPDVAESPVLVDGDVVASAPDGTVYRVLAETGRVRWRTDVDCDVSTSVTADGGDLYVGCGDGTLFRLAAADGTVRARLALHEPLEGRLLITGDDRLIVPGGRGWIAAVGRDLDRLLWERRDLEPLSVVQPIRWGEHVLTGTKGRLIALARSDGRTAWTVPVEGSVRGLGAAGDVLLVGTIEGTIHALRRLP